MSRVLLLAVRKAFEDPAFKAEFEEWYREKYGEEYDWKQNTGKQN